VKSLEDVRKVSPLVSFSNELAEEHLALKQFLRNHLYRHYKVARMTKKAERIITELFGAFLGEPRLLPPEHQAKAHHDKARAIADYIAGMTDRYAMREYRRLFGIEEVSL